MGNGGSGGGESEPGAESQPDESMRERANRNRLKLWVLMEADRRVLTAVLLTGLFVSMVALGVADPSPLQEAVAASDPVDTLFQAYVTAIVTGVTLVVTLNQLVLSQELGPVGSQREQMREAMTFRRDVADELDAPVSPAEPATFLRSIIEEIAERAARLEDAATDSGDDELADQVRTYVDELTRGTDSVAAQLTGAEFGTYDVVSAVLDFDYSWNIYASRRIQAEHADALTEEADAAFDDLETVLEFFGPAREHFKTLYFQWELINLSRAMLYAALPALVVASSMIVYYDAQALPGATLGVSNDVLVTSAAATVAAIPFVLLLAYILRIATVAKWTLSIGPFVLRETDRSDEFDWE